jgi:hypothetical protein
VNGSGSKRLAALSSALVLVALAAFAPAVTASQVKPEIVVVEKVDQAGPYVAGTSYNAAWVTLAVRNGGNGSYTQVRLSVTACQDRQQVTDPCVPDVNVVPRGALDATSATPALSPYCSISDTGYNCALPNIAGNTTSPGITFVFSSASGVPFDVDAAVSLKDLTNTGGSNQERDDAASNLIDVDVSARSDKQTPFFPPNQAFSVSTWKQGNVGQRATLKLPSSSSGYLVDLQEFLAGEEPTLPAECAPLAAPELANYGQLVAATVNQGVTVSPYLEWTLEITFGKGVVAEPLTGVAHCTLSDGSYVVHNITTGTGDRCGSSVPDKGCMVWSKNSPYQTRTTGNQKTGNFNTTYIVTIRTLTNGWAKTTK